jgi:hypothetical protein
MFFHINNDFKNIPKRPQKFEHVYMFMNSIVENKMKNSKPKMKKKKTQTNFYVVKVPSSNFISEPVQQTKKKKKKMSHKSTRRLSLYKTRIGGSSKNQEYARNSNW